MPNLPLLSGAYGGRPNMVAAEPQSIYGYQIRKPFAGEDKYFKGRPDVGGMAAGDNRVIINPYSPISKEMKDLVRTNETARLAMRNGYPRPDFELTPKQQEFFNTVQNGNPYSEDLQDLDDVPQDTVDSFWEYVKGTISSMTFDDIIDYDFGVE